MQEAEASAAEMNPYANIQIESMSTIMEFNGKTNRRRYSRATYCIDLFADTSDPLETFPIEDPNSAC